MEKINLIKQYNIVTPNYSLDDKEISFDIYISPNQQVCIIAKLDNNYICWCSITAINDYDTNSSIFQYILNLNVKTISNESSALGEKYNEVKNWHHLIFSKRAYQNENRFFSPVNSCFFMDGKFFASEINTFYKQERSKCDYRLIDDTYVSILEKYKTILFKANQHYSYYHEVKPIIKILEDERYLKLSSVFEIRQLYLECIQKSNDLYNRYMTEVR
ncbi:hypothetical protein AM499_04245 [Bacillus sp. FJAT-22090]|nr:hypothetical protein AM499_04245 [Bacillus sp. FJAT-22090]